MVIQLYGELLAFIEEEILIYVLNRSSNNNWKLKV